MSNDFLCCTGARLSGQVLSGLDRGGAAWTVELQHVRRLVYSERRTRNSTVYSLRLKDNGGWRTVSVDIPRQRMAPSIDLIEHRALSARVAEVLAELRPGFWVRYEVVQGGRWLPLWVGLGAGVLVAALLWLWAFVAQVQGPPAGVFPAITLGAGLVSGVGAGLVMGLAMRRRVPDVSASALPGLLTAASRRG